MGEFGIGQSIKRFEDGRLLRGGGRFHDDVNVRRPDPRGDRPLDPRPRADPWHRHGGRAPGPGGRRHLHRQRPGQGVARHHADDAQAQAARRLTDVGAGPSRPHRRARAVCRRSARAGDRRDAGPGGRRGRPRPGRLRAAGLHHRHGRRRRARQRQGVGRVPGQRLQPVRGRRPRRHRRGLRVRAQGRQAPLRHHPRARAVHGAARGPGRVGSARGALHPLRRRAVSRTGCATRWPPTSSRSPSTRSA